MRRVPELIVAELMRSGIDPLARMTMVIGDFNVAATQSGVNYVSPEAALGVGVGGPHQHAWA